MKYRMNDSVEVAVCKKATALMVGVALVAVPSITYGAINAGLRTDLAYAYENEAS